MNEIDKIAKAPDYIIAEFIAKKMGWTKSNYSSLSPIIWQCDYPIGQEAFIVATDKNREKGCWLPSLYKNLYQAHIFEEWLIKKYGQELSTYLICLEMVCGGTETWHASGMERAVAFCDCFRFEFELFINPKEYHC